MSREKEAYLRFLIDIGERMIPIPGGEISSEDVREHSPSGASEVADGRGFSGSAAEPVDARDKERVLHEYYLSIRNCTKCALHRSRTNFVFGCGSADADVMFIGEAPGGEEDKQGIPFVGRAGKLLDRILAAAGLKRSEVYIANVLKCRPPNNRDPLPSEERMCLPYLHRQIEIIQPKVICCLGRVAANALLKAKNKMSDMRGIVHKFHGIPMVVTYHPAALLRNDRLKKPIWEDFQFLLEVLEQNS